MILRRGHTTTEFWLALVSVGLIAFLRLPSDLANPIAAIVGGYGLSRGLAKRT